MLKLSNITETLVTARDLPAKVYLESNGLVALEAENGERRSGLSHAWLLKTSLPGYTGTSYLQPSLDVDALVQTSTITTSPQAEYLVNFSTAETYTVWVRGYASNAAGDSLEDFENLMNNQDSRYTSGVRDPGVFTRDLRANHLGAAFGVDAFYFPHALPPQP